MSKVTVRQLNKELDAVRSAVERANNTVGNAEEKMSALGKRILAAQQTRDKSLRGTHSAQFNNRAMRSKMGGSRRRGRKGRKGTRRGRR